MKGRHKGLKILASIIFLSATAVCTVFVFLVVFVYKNIDFEADERLFESAGEFSSTTFYANGAEDKMGEYKPVVIEISGNMRKIFYSSDEIGEYLKAGFVAVEDKIFYEHRGIDLKRTLMAAANYVTRRQRVFGASTITQQVIKNISGDNQLSLRRKLEEIIRAIHLERKYTKEEIFRVYLNIIPMSENIYGVGAASRAYFGKEPSELSPEEAATLIGITNAPTAYNPYINPDACRRKRNIVLSVMYKDGIISAVEYERAAATPLTVISREDREDRIDSWFIETVIDDVTEDLASKYEITANAARMMLLRGGYKVYTTMDPSLQQTMEDYFENRENFSEEIGAGLNYAMTVTDNDTGYLVGIVGRVGKKQGNRLLNHATVPHIPASALKPLALYAPLIDDGTINWATVFDDVPVSFSENDEEYREYPKNSPYVYDGLTCVRDAVCKSKNTVAVRLCNKRGTKAVFNSLRNDFHFDTLIEKEGSLTDIATAPMALGQLCRGVSLRKLTEGYGVFGSEGEWREAVSYLYLIDNDGHTVINREQRKNRIFKPTTARIMNQLLMTVTNEGTARTITLKHLVNTAGKTGTSGGSREKTFVGYTPYYTAGIWCGYDKADRAVTNLSKNHIEIWDDVMTLVHKNILREGELQEFSTVGLYRLPYCKDSGRLYSDACIFDPRGDRRDFGYFTADNAPCGECDRHILCKFDSETKGIACDSCPEKNIVYVALLKISDRAFPKEIYVTDAEFVYRDIDRYTPRPQDPEQPYFYYTISDDSFVGKSKTKKQFNSACPIHN